MDHIEKSKELDLPPDQYVLVGGSVLDIHGIRESDDIDVVVSKGAFQTLKDRGWEVDIPFQEKWSRKRLVRDVFEVFTDVSFAKFNYYLPFEILKDASQQIKGIYVQPLGLLLLSKLDNGREKDLRDIELIKGYFKTKC